MTCANWDSSSLVLGLVDGDFSSRLNATARHAKAIDYVRQATRRSDPTMLLVFGRPES
jgi:hypothetical protein